MTLFVSEPIKRAQDGQPLCEQEDVQRLQSDLTALRAQLAGLGAGHLTTDEIAKLRLALAALAIETETNETIAVQDGFNQADGYQMPANQTTDSENPTNAVPDANGIVVTSQVLGGHRYIRLRNNAFTGNPPDDQNEWKIDRAIFGFKVDSIAYPSGRNDDAHSILAAFRLTNGNAIEMRVNPAGELYFWATGESEDHYPEGIFGGRVTVAANDYFVVALRQLGNGNMGYHFSKNGSENNDGDMGFSADGVLGSTAYRDLDIGEDEGATLSKVRAIQHDGDHFQPSHDGLVELWRNRDENYVFGIVAATTTSVEHVRFTEPVLTKRARAETKFKLPGANKNRRSDYSNKIVTDSPGGENHQRYALPVADMDTPSPIVNFHNHNGIDNGIFSFNRDGRIRLQFSIAFNQNLSEVTAFPIYAEILDIGSTLPTGTNTVALTDTTRVGFEQSHYNREYAGDATFVPFTLNFPSLPVEASKYYTLSIFGALWGSTAVNSPFISLTAFSNGLIIEEIE